jgi:hypothetical protein
MSLVPFYRHKTCEIKSIWSINCLNKRFARLKPNKVGCIRYPYRLSLVSLKTGLLNMRNRLVQVLFFIPCCIINFLEIWFILIPIWIITGTPITEREHIFDFLFDKLKK